MDIATAKPSAAERARVPHHLIDVVDPGERYDVARYQRDGRAALADIAARDRRAIVVGGTGLYLRALLDGLALGAVPKDPDLRSRLEELAASEGAGAVHARLAALDPEAAARVDPRNVRRLIRYTEIATLAGPLREAQRREGAIDALWYGLAPPRPHVDARIAERVAAMVERGVLDETRRLLAQGVDPRLPSMSAHGYVHWAAHLRGEIDLAAAVERTARDTRAYARRQMTWFRRDERIRWLDPTVSDPLPAVLAA
jgi:tRNA dimethylallyltransferase